MRIFGPEVRFLREPEYDATRDRRLAELREDIARLRSKIRQLRQDEARLSVKRDALKPSSITFELSCPRVKAELQI